MNFAKYGKVTMTPTIDEYKKGATHWRINEGGVSILLSHHGVRDDPDFTTGLPYPGTWAYYLIVPEQMYPNNWDQFKCHRDEAGFEHNGPAFDDVDFHGGITWSSSKPYFCRKTMRQWDASKVGCDYAHLWDAEAYYPDNFETVSLDAKRSAKQLLDLHKDFFLRCGYTGIWASKEEFYTARNGEIVHNSVAELENATSHWLPKEKQNA